jgi:hypothetical protein
VSHSYTSGARQPQPAALRGGPRRTHEGTRDAHGPIAGRDAGGLDAIR